MKVLVPIVFALLPLAIIGALNALFDTGTPITVTTYISALLFQGMWMMLVPNNDRIVLQELEERPKEVLALGHPPKTSAPSREHWCDAGNHYFECAITDCPGGYTVPHCSVHSPDHSKRVAKDPVRA